MWIISNIGFFSAVQKPGDSFLTVRARHPADLDRLRDNFMPELSLTKKGGGTDYPVRATISHEAFASGLAKLSAAIDYPNFKTEVAKKMGKRRAHTYSEVWSALANIENEPDTSAEGS